jgi:hypothetical protein
VYRHFCRINVRLKGFSNTFGGEIVMRNILTTSLLAGSLLLGGASVARAQVSFGIRIGPPPAVRVEHRPPRPGPGFVWVRGYWYPDSGYWTRPPYQGAYWVPPRRDGGMFYEGYWNGPRGRVDHDHAWDRDRGRDYDHFRNNDDRDNRGNYDHRDNDHHDNDDHH